MHERLRRGWERVPKVGSIQSQKYWSGPGGGNAEAEDASSEEGWMSVCTKLQPVFFRHATWLRLENTAVLHPTYLLAYRPYPSHYPTLSWLKSCQLPTHTHTYPSQSASIHCLAVLGWHTLPHLPLGDQSPLLSSASRTTPTCCLFVSDGYSIHPFSIKMPQAWDNFPLHPLALSTSSCSFYTASWHSLWLHILVEPLVCPVVKWAWHPLLQTFPGKAACAVHHQT